MAAAVAAFAVAALVAFFLVVVAVGVGVVGQDAADERLDGVVRKAGYPAVDLKRSVCPKCWKIISSSSYVTATFMLGLLSLGPYIKYAFRRFVKHKICW